MTRPITILQFKAIIEAGEQKRTKPQRHTDLRGACLNTLALQRCVTWANNTGAYKTEDGRYIRYGKRGSSDIIGWSPAAARFIAVECKVGRDKLSKEQRAFLRDVAAAGGLAFVARETEAFGERLRRALREGRGWCDLEILGRKEA